MATGSDDDGGSSHHNKRSRGSTGDEDDIIDISDDDVYGTDDDGDCVGEDYIYDDNSDHAGEYMAEEETNAADSAAAAAAKKGYTVLTEDAILARQQKAAADVAEVLSIPSSFAAILLRHFKWSPSRVEEQWFSDDSRVRAAVGLLPADGGGDPVAMAFSTKCLNCGICFSRFKAGEMRSAGCDHFYCNDCWSGYIHAAVGDGPRCLSLRCPTPACSAAVVGDLVNAVSSDEDRERYTTFALRSYVEEGGGGIKWCPAAGCTLAVKLAGDEDEAVTDVFCGCRHGFCWRCGEEAHRPVSCKTVRAWLAKNSSDAESANWVLANTKHCPKCHRPIEKNQGCNHMTCRAPCRYQFCWLCLDPWSKHRGCSRYGSNQAREAVDVNRPLTAAGQGKAVGKEEMRRRRQAKASLDRYLYHYERWAANQKSLKKALVDMDELEKSGLKKMADALEVREKDLEFMTKAYEMVADGRRTMRWVYAYGYYLDPVKDKAKRGLFDHLQDDANSWLESLHSCAELERKRLSTGIDEQGGAAMNEMYRAYKKKLEDLTGATRHYFGNLVKAFETDMPEFNSVQKK